jgi:hypothetical protein
MEQRHVLRESKLQAAAIKFLGGDNGKNQERHNYKHIN